MARTWWKHLQRRWTNPVGPARAVRQPGPESALHIEQLEDRLTPASVVLGTAPLAADVAGGDYATRITATGGSGQYLFSLAAGALPAGVSLDQSGVLSGQTTAAGTYKFTVKATDAATPTLTATYGYTLAVLPGALTSVTVAAPAAVTAGTAAAVTVTAADSFGNVQTGYNGTVQLTSSDGQTPSVVSVTLSKGVGKVSTVFTTADTLTLSATVASVTGTSAPLTVNPGAAATFVVTAPSVAVAGAGFEVGIEAFDKYGNPATGYTGTAALSASDKQIPSPRSIAVVGGVGSGAVTLTKADAVTLTAAAGAVKGTAAVAVSPLGEVASFAVTTPTATTAGAGAAVTVTAKDVYGNVVTGYSGAVTFTSSDGQTADGSVTLANGVGTGPVVLDLVGSVALTATDGSAVGTSGRMTVNPGAAAALVVTAPSTAVAGTGFTVGVKAYDAYGNPATTTSGAVTLTASDGQAVSTAQVSLIRGAATGAHVLTRVDTVTLTATAGSVTGTSDGITVNPGAATTFVVTAPSTAVAGTGFEVGIEAFDRYGNPATGYTGTAALSASDKQIPSPRSIAVTGGVGSGTVTLTKVDGVTLTAAAGAVKGTAAVAVSPLGEVASFVITTPSTAVAGAGVAVTVTARDVYGNVVAGYTGTVTFTSSDGQTVDGLVTLANGVGTGSITLTKVGSVTLTATDGSVVGTSGKLTVAPGAATSLVVTAPSTAVAGTGFTVGVKAYDAYGNPATTTSGMVTLTASDSQTVSSASVSLSGGATTGAHVLTKVGTVTLTATLKLVTGTSGAITVSPGAAASFVVTAPSTAVAGTGFEVDLTAFDKYGNPATGYTGTAALSASDKQIPSPQSIAVVGGVGSRTVTLTKADTVTLTAAAGVVKGTDTVAVSPLGEVASFAVTTPSTAVAGVGAAVTVTARDVYGNVVTGYTGTVTFTSSDGQTVSGSAAVVNGVGTGSVTLTKVGSVTLTATDGSVAGTSGKLTVAPGAAAALVVTAPSTAVAGTGFTVGVKAYDAYGNPATTTSGAVTLTASDGQAVSSASVSLSGGAATGAHVLTRVGTVTLTATLKSVTGTSGAITVSPGAAASFVVTAPATATVGTGFTVTLTAVDKYGNATTGYNGTATLTASDKQIPSPASVAVTGGVGTATVTLSKTDSVTLTATAGIVKGTSGSIAVQGGNIDNTWISQHVTDPLLATVVQTRFTDDNAISYSDMLAIFGQAAGEATTLSSATLTSLQALASADGAAALNISPDVQSLTGHVVNGDPANAVISSGNLAAGSSSAQMQTLVADWFLGAAHPSAATSYGTATYQLAGGSLFGSGGPSYQDVYQGQMGDCWLLAAFGVTAANDPSVIRGMFIDQGMQTENGVQVHVWTVRFYHNGVPTYLSVDSYLPATGGGFFFANQGQSITSSSNVLWVPLLEKAYAQLSASGWNQRQQANAYQSLNGGLASTVLPVLTGKAEAGDAFTNAGLTAALAAGRLLTLGTPQDVPSLGIVGSHDYTVLGYDSSTQTYTLMNPWGWNTNYTNAGAPAPGILHLTWTQVQQYFYLDGDCNP